LLHPVETILGLGLFFGSVALVGGVHIYTLGALFTTYTALNILNHAGIDVPHFPFKTLGVLAAKHDRHHHSMLSGNYASITPLPDIIFGTVE
jgi:sterol desaturase/sphingolipid hydroxylase (fatty acid hydroxylase superfamily)